MTERTITFDDDHWQLVPRVATKKMIDKALSATHIFLGLTGSKRTINRKKMVIRYRALLCAAPCLYEKPSDWDRHTEYERIEDRNPEFQEWESGEYARPSAECP